MSLTITNALISTQVGSGAVVNQANGATIVLPVGGVVLFALQSTAGVGKWTLSFNCPNYPALHQKQLDWLPGQFNGFYVAMPDYPVGGGRDQDPLQGIQVLSTVSDASGGSVPQAQYQVRTVASPDGPVQTIRCRGVVLSALGAYTNANGVLTENANGAIGTIDGLTVAVGDRLFLPPGIAAAAADVGVYQVVATGSAGAVFVLQRVSDMPNGALVGRGSEIHVTEGTVMQGTQWVLDTADPVTVGTTAQAWYPRAVTQSVTLAAGTKTIQNVPIKSTSLSNAICVRTATGGTVSTTVMYLPTSAGANGFTAGALGTGQVVLQACIGAGTIQNADTSVLAVTITNPV